MAEDCVNAEKLAAVELWLSEVLSKRISLLNMKNFNDFHSIIELMKKSVHRGLTGNQMQTIVIHEVDTFYNMDVLSMLNMTNDKMAFMSLFHKVALALLILVMGLNRNGDVFMSAARSIPIRYHQVLVQLIKGVVEVENIENVSLNVLFSVPTYTGDSKENVPTPSSCPAPFPPSVADISVSKETPIRISHDRLDESFAPSPLDVLKPRLMNSPFTASNHIEMRDQDIAKLRTQLLEKEDLLFASETDNAIYKEKLETVTNALQETQSNLKLKERQINDLQDEVDSLKLVQQELKRTKNELSVAKESLSKVRRSVVTLRSSQEKLQMENENLSRQLKAAQLSARSVSHEEKLRKRAALLRETLFRTDETMLNMLDSGEPRASTRNATVQVSLEEVCPRCVATAEEPRCASPLDHMEDLATILRSDELENLRKVHQETVQAHESEVVDLRAQLDGLNQLVRDKEAELMVFNAQVESLQTAVEQVRGCGEESLKRVQAEQERERDQWRRQLQHAEEREAAANRRLAEQLEANEAVRAASECELAELVAHAEQLEAKLQTAEEVGSRDKAEAAKLHQALDGLTQVNKKLTKVADERLARLESLSAELEEEQRRQSSNARRAKEEAAEADQRLRMELSRVAELQASLADQQERVSQLTDNWKGSERRNASLVEELEAANNALAELRGALSSAQLDLDVLRKNFDRIKDEHGYATERLGSLSRLVQERDDLQMQVDSARQHQQETIARLVRIECEKEELEQKLALVTARSHEAPLTKASSTGAVEHSEAVKNALARAQQAEARLDRFLANQTSSRTTSISTLDEENTATNPEEKTPPGSRPSARANQPWPPYAQSTCFVDPAEALPSGGPVSADCLLRWQARSRLQPEEGSPHEAQSMESHVRIVPESPMVKTESQSEVDLHTLQVKSHQLSKLRRLLQSKHKVKRVSPQKSASLAQARPRPPTKLARFFSSTGRNES